MRCDVRMDGGWGWIVVAACSMTMMAISGIARSFGIFFTALLEEFHGSASLTSFAGGLRLSMYTLLSPFAVYFADRFSDRLVVMTGAIILCLSFALIFPAPNLAYVIVFVGVNGIGSALTVPCFEAVIGKYFRKRISLATTLGFCGSSMGQISLPYLLLYLLREYGLRGMILIYGGILFHIAVFGALIRPAPKAIIYPGKSRLVPLLPLEETENHEQNTVSRDARTDLQRSLIHGKKALSTSKSEEHGYFVSNTQTSISSLSSSTASALGGFDVTSCIPEKGSENAEHKTPVTIKDIFRKIFDSALLKDARFMLYLVARTFALSGFIAQITYLVPWSIEKGHSLDSAAILLSISGGAEIVGRIIMGFLGDCKPIGPVKLMIIYTFLIGTGNVLVSFASAYAGMVAYAVAYGLWGSAGHLLTVPIICLFFDRSRVPSGVGLVFLIQGVSIASCIAIMGAIKDTTGSYQGVFIMCASFQYIASALMIIAMFINSRRERECEEGRDDDVTVYAERTESVVRNGNSS